jgi:hypothetical protein
LKRKVNVKPKDYGVCVCCGRRRRLEDGFLCSECLAEHAECFRFNLGDAKNG